jgi:hypothetical protein
MTADEAHIFLNAVPEPYHVAVLDALAAVGATLEELDSLAAFGKGLSESQVEYAEARRIVDVERQAAASSLYQDDRRYWAAKGLDDRGAVPLSRLVRARGIAANVVTDLPHLPPPYLTETPGAGIADDLTVLERFPIVLDFLAEYSVTSIIGKSGCAFARPELAAVMSRLPWVFADREGLMAELGFDPRNDQKSLREYLERAGDVWSLRARVRLLNSLTPEARRNEEHSIESELMALRVKGGLFVAQCAELFAARSRYCSIPRLVDFALSIPNLVPADGAVLRLRLLPLIGDHGARARLLAEFFVILDSIGEEGLRAPLLHWASRYGVRDELAKKLRVDRIEDPIRRAFANNQPGAVLVEAVDRFLPQSEFWGGEAAAPLLVYARLSDAISNSTASPELPAYSDPLQAVAAAGLANDPHALISATCNASISSPLGLDQAFREHEAVLQSPDLVSQVSAVITASAEGLGPLSARGVVSALESNHDELRGRAISLLLPPVEIKTDASAGLSAAGAGLATLLQMWEAALEINPGTALPLVWRLEHSILDSVDLAAKLCEIVEADGPIASAALRILCGFKVVNAEVQESLAQRTLVCSPRLRAGLWILFSKIYFAGRQSKAPPVLPPSIFCGLTASPDCEIMLASPTDVVAALRSGSDPKAAHTYLTTSCSVRLSQAFSSFNAENLETVRRIGSVTFSRTATAEERHADFAAGAASLLEIQDGPKLAHDLLTYLSGSGITDPQPGGFLRSTLMVLIAAAAERSPTRSAAPFENPESRDLIATIAREANSYPARRAALLLLGHIIDRPNRQPISAEVDAMMSAVLDVPDVIDAALSAAGRVRSLSKLGVRKLIEALHHPSAARASLAGRILIVIARNSETGQELRDRILDAVQQFVAHASSGRRVYFCGYDANTPPAPTIREQLLDELSASGGGAVQRR